MNYRCGLHCVVAQAMGVETNVLKPASASLAGLGAQIQANRSGLAPLADKGRLALSAMQVAFYFCGP
jgi:hypothetical protein